MLRGLLVILALTGCAKDPVRPTADPGRRETGIMDIPMAWTRDGEWIAFRRLAWSTYGPPGVYVVHRTGAIVRYVYGPADLFFPREATFSPDGRFLAMVDYRRDLFIVELSTLHVHRPLFTETDVYSPDWSPDGGVILYSQFYAGGSSTTADSLGLFLLDVVSGTTRSLRWGPDPVYSFYPAWSSDGRMIAMDELVAPYKALSVMNADGTGHRYLVPARPGQLYRDIDWYRRGPGEAARILFWKTEHPAAGPYLIHPNGTGMVPFWHRIQGEAFVSPIGTEYVRSHPDPQTHWRVLYVGRVDDLTDVALRQVTRYEPANPTTSAPTMEVQDDEQ